MWAGLRVEWLRGQCRRWGRWTALVLALLLLLQYLSAGPLPFAGLLPAPPSLHALPPFLTSLTNSSAFVAPPTPLTTPSNSSDLHSPAKDNSTSREGAAQINVTDVAMTKSPATTTAPSTSTAPTNGSERLLGQAEGLEDCPVIPSSLVGPIKVWFDYPQWPELEKLYPYLEAGGHGKPASCKARHRVAVVVPYRDRDKHLRGFLHNLHSLLTKQQLDYAIVVVEQAQGQTFNRGKLMNVGFVEAMRLYDFQCVIFHDVDLFPEDDRNIYSCPDQPRHMSVAVDKFNYRLPYTDIFGGISALTTAQFRKINGVSNDFWGWGGEDDDFATRVKSEGFRISRYPANIARYKMIKHTTEKANPVNKCRFALIGKTKRRYKADGLSSLSYTLTKRELRPLYVHLLVDLHEEQGREAVRKQHLCAG